MINKNQLKMKQSSSSTLSQLHQDKEHLAACSFKQKKNILNDASVRALGIDLANLIVSCLGVRQYCSKPTQETGFCGMSNLSQNSEELL